MPSSSFTLFNGRRRKEILELVKIFEDRNAKPGPNTDYALLNSALLLLVSSWEVYCEDAAIYAVRKTLSDKDITFEKLPNRSRSRFVNAMRSIDAQAKNPLESPFCKLASVGWKEQYIEQVESFVSSVNTPRLKGKRTHHDLDGLYDLVIGESLSTKLNDLFDEPSFSTQIDDAITLRGSIAHKGSPPNGNLRPEQVRSIVKLFCAAAAGVEKIVKDSTLEATGVLTWQITKPVKDALSSWANCN